VEMDTVLYTGSTFKLFGLQDSKADKRVDASVLW
jgi:hypothetical protein